MQTDEATPAIPAGVSQAGAWVLNQYQLTKDAAPTPSDVASGPMPRMRPQRRPSLFRRWLRMRLILAPVTVLVVTGGLAAIIHHGSRHSVSEYGAGKGGVEITSAAGHFRATFPTTPKQTTTQVPLPNGRNPLKRAQWVSGSDRDLYEIDVWQVPSRTRPNLKAGVSGAASEVDGWILESKITRFDGHRAAEGAVRTKDGVFLNMIDFVSHHRLYVLMTGGMEEHVPGFDRFKASFRVTGAPSSAAR